MVARISLERAPVWVRGQLDGRRGTRWVGIDGLGAAGKSTLAQNIAAVLPDAVVVAVDDFGRAGVRGWDRDLFVRQVLAPLLAGQAARYQTWDLLTDSPLAWIEVPSGRAVVVEGVSATDRRVPVPWDLTLWVDTPASVRWSRIVARDGSGLLDRWRDDWLPSERDYVATQRPQERVDVLVTDADPDPGRPAGTGTGALT